MSTRSRDRAVPPFVLLGNGRVAREFLEGLTDDEAWPSAVILNAPDKQREATEIVAACARRAVPVDAWSPDIRCRLLERLRRSEGLWLLSVYFGHVLDAELLDAAGGRAVNLHPSLLPWCRGVHTNVWPLVEGCPAGVTLHVMVPRLDAGPVLTQAEVAVEPWDTAATLHRRLEDRALELLRRDWPAGALAAWPGAPQGSGGSYHNIDDLQSLDEYRLDEHPDARAFFDVLRARSFPPYSGLKIRLGGCLVEAVVSLRELADA